VNLTTVKIRQTAALGNVTSAAKGFSLVEVVVALGLFAFCVVAIVGLLGVALGSTRSVVNETAAINVAESIFGAWAVQANPNSAVSLGNIATNLPSLSGQSEQVVYFNDLGLEVETVDEASFQMTYTPTVVDEQNRIYRLDLTFRWPPERAVSTEGAIQTRSFVRSFVK
jgi:uncharacterized protein (TIGR02598 family)